MAQIIVTEEEFEVHPAADNETKNSSNLAT